MTRTRVPHHVDAMLLPLGHTHATTQHTRLLAAAGEHGAMTKGGSQMQQRIRGAPFPPLPLSASTCASSPRSEEFHQNNVVLHNFGFKVAIGKLQHVIRCCNEDGRHQNKEKLHLRSSDPQYRFEARGLVHVDASDWSDLT